MNLKKIFAVVALVGLFVVGGAFASSELTQARSGFNGHGRSQARMMEATGLSESQINEFRENNCADGVTLIDKLKEEGLYEEWKVNTLNDLEERLALQVENGRITEAEAASLLEDLEAKTEDGPPFNFGHIMGKGQGRGHKNNSKGFRNR